jgi:hypothetical protein
MGRRKYAGYITIRTDLDVDVDINEFYDELGSGEKETLVEWLKEDGYLVGRIAEYDTPGTPMQDMFNENMNKIAASYHLLTNEEIELIEKLAKKY